MFDDSSTDFSYLVCPSASVVSHCRDSIAFSVEQEETEQALLDLQRQLQPWLAQQTQRHHGGSAHMQLWSTEREPAKVRSARKLLDRLPRHTRLNQRVTTLGVTLEVRCGHWTAEVAMCAASDCRHCCC
jgi:hypothetical protein